MIISTGTWAEDEHAYLVKGKLHGLAAKEYEKHAKNHAPRDWILATFCNMTAAILEQRELISVNENRIRDLEAKLTALTHLVKAQDAAISRLEEIVQP